MTIEPDATRNNGVAPSLFVAAIYRRAMVLRLFVALPAALVQPVPF